MGFMVESTVEAFPNCIIQLIAICTLPNSNINIINIISILLSIISLSSKTIVFSYKNKKKKIKKYQIIPFFIFG